MIHQGHPDWKSTGHLTLVRIDILVMSFANPITKDAAPDTRIQSARQVCLGPKQRCLERGSLLAGYRLADFSLRPYGQNVVVSGL